jgi:glycosyltransferase involved in cell wall biosynthesis
MTMSGTRIVDPANGNRQKVDIDFSLAIHNRTGKYFIGLDLLSIAGLPVGNVYYWHLARSAPPEGLLGRVVGRLQHWQIRGQALGGAFRLLPRRRPRRPLLHLDPFTVPTTDLRPCDAVLCHDIGPVTHPALFDADVGLIYRHIYDECARVGPHMIFVSQATRTAFLETYPRTDPARTRVIYPAIRAGIAASSPIAVPGVTSPFLLTVGSIGARKNQARCIAAFAASGLADRGFQYVICGGREPGFEEVAAAALDTAGVVMLPYVSDAALSWLYGNASGFVLASLLEGFGMPVAEAIARGLVPLVGRGGVLHEVAGDGAVLVDPESEASIADGMRALGAMTKADCAARLTWLRQSIARFDDDAIRASWRQAFDAILGHELRNDGMTKRSNVR